MTMPSSQFTNSPSMHSPRVEAILNQLDKAKQDNLINFEFQRDNRHKFKYDFVKDSDHIRVSFGRGGFAFFERSGKLINQEAANEVELKEAEKVIRDACSGSIGVAPPHYKGSGINPDWVRWNKWVKARQDKPTATLAQQPQSKQPSFDRTPVNAAKPIRD